MSAHRTLLILAFLQCLASSTLLANTPSAGEQSASDNAVLEYFYGTFLSLYDVQKTERLLAGGTSPLRRYRGEQAAIRAYPQCGALPRNAPTAARHADALANNIHLPQHFHSILMDKYALGAHTTAQIMRKRAQRILATATDALVISNALGARKGPTPNLPKNTRQVAEGYWLGSYPSSKALNALQAQNIKLIITATRAPNIRELNVSIDKLGITHLVLPFGSRFPSPDKFYPQILKFKPHEIFIHCDHGGDRSGTMLAFMLAARHHWQPHKALLAVLYPSKTDILGLLSTLKSRQIEVPPADLQHYLGIYSAEYNGGFGGLKARNSDYQKLILAMLDALDTLNDNSLPSPCQNLNHTTHTQTDAPPQTTEETRKIHRHRRKADTPHAHSQTDTLCPHRHRHATFKQTPEDSATKSRHRHRS